MGSWKLEVAKMFVYVMFPVATFHIFNQPEIFEDWVTKTRKEMYPPISSESVEQVKQLRLEYQKRMQEARRKEEMKI